MTVAISPFSNTSEPLADDDVEGRRPSSVRPEEAFDALVDLAPVRGAMNRPHSSRLRFGVGLLRPQFETQQVPEEMVEAKPLAVGVQRDEEHRLPLQLLEDELGVGRTGQVTDQLRAHLVQHGDLEEELAPFLRLGRQGPLG